MTTTGARVCFSYNFISFFVCETSEKFTIESSSEERTPDDDILVSHATQRTSLVRSMLFRRGFNGELLRCLTNEEAYKVVGEAHSGACGGHVNGPMLAKKIL